MTLHTIGYGNRSPEVVFAAIPPGALVIDVRARPGCRWQPAYSKRQLAAHFGSRYHHRAALGNVSGSGEAWVSPLPGMVERDLAVIARLLEAGRSVVLLCAEADVMRCHRRWVAEALAERVDGLAIVHLLEK